jgi:protein-S-isoprenylcysteine O-methyltransferase Ste14
VSYSRIARRIRVPLGFLLAVAFMWLAHPSWKSIFAGAIVSMIGVLIRAAASGHVKKNSELTTTGPYAYTRNPLYLGSLIIAAGFAIGSRSWWVVIIMAVMFLAIYVPVIRSEESFLRATFPGFEDYCQEVPRLVPSLRHAKSNSGTFSRDLYLQHREYNAALGTVAMLGALVAKLVWFHH